MKNKFTMKLTAALPFSYLLDFNLKKNVNLISHPEERTQCRCLKTECYGQYLELRERT